MRELVATIQIVRNEKGELLARDRSNQDLEPSDLRNWADLIEANPIKSRFTPQEQSLIKSLPPVQLRGWSPPDGYIYFAVREDMSLVKIGRTRDLSQRIKQLRTTLAPTRVSLLHAFYSRCVNVLEKDMHKKFMPFRVQGEWHAFSSEAIEEAKETLVTLEESYEQPF